MGVSIGKRGLSPVVASVFMILLIFVLAVLVFSWARGFVEGRTDENVLSSAQLCSAVNFKIAIVDKDGEDYDFEVVNKGDVNISSLKFRIYPGGNSNVVDSGVEILAGRAITGSVVLSEPIDRVEVLPVVSVGLLEESSVVVCDKYVINLGDVGE